MMYLINFVDYIDDLPITADSRKKILKYELKLNRITGKLTEVSYRKSGTLDYDPDTNTFISNYEFSKNREYQCSKEDALF